MPWYTITIDFDGKSTPQSVQRSSSCTTCNSIDADHCVREDSEKHRIQVTIRKQSVEGNVTVVAVSHMLAT